MKMTEKDLKLQIIEKADVIAKELSKGKDIELKTSGNGLKVLSADKKILK